MTIDYNRVWETMNELESVSSKICSAREILDSAIDALESGNREKAETLMYAADEFLQYYLEDFDRKFKNAWNETVVKLKEEDPCMPPWGHSDLEYGLSNSFLTQDRNSNFPGENTICDKNDPSPECKGAWTSFWNDSDYISSFSTDDYNVLGATTVPAYGGNDVITFDEPKQDKVVKWRLPVEVDGVSGEYFVSFPDDLMNATGLKEGDNVQWVDQGDGSYLLRKI
jgi:hypothetical protein